MTSATPDPREVTNLTLRRFPLVYLLAAVVLGTVAAAAWGSENRATAARGKTRAVRYMLVGRIGKPGKGPGTLAVANGVAVDQVCGDVYISDKERGIVDRFDLNGKFLNVVGRSGRGEGGIGTPYGLFVSPTNVAPMNPQGAPPLCKGSSALVKHVWVADESAGRISIFSPDGTWTGGWCSSPASSQPRGCTVRRGSGSTGGFPAGPVDVWVTDKAVFTPFGGLIREYDLAGNFIANSASLSGPASVAVSGGRIWASEATSKLALLSLHTDGGELPLLRELGSGKYDGKTPGSFAGVRAVATAPNGMVYVLDSTRVQVFSPLGRYLSSITLPDSFGSPSDVAVRYDGTVYVTAADSPGALVYSPGPVVSLRLKQVGSHLVELSGSVRPANVGASIELQQFENGFRTIVRLRLDRKSAFRFVWTAPSAHVTYALRALFRDRASRLEQLALK